MLPVATALSPASIAAQRHSQRGSVTPAAAKAQLLQIAGRQSTRTDQLFARLHARQSNSKSSCSGQSSSSCGLCSSGLCRISRRSAQNTCPRGMLMAERPILQLAANGFPALACIDRCDPFHFRHATGRALQRHVRLRLLRPGSMHEPVKGRQRPCQAIAC